MGRSGVRNLFLFRDLREINSQPEESRGKLGKFDYDTYHTRPGCGVVRVRCGL